MKCVYLHGSDRECSYCKQVGRNFVCMSSKAQNKRCEDEDKERKELALVLSIENRGW